MKKIGFLIVLLLILLVGCSNEKVTIEDLIDGHWIGTTGYENGEKIDEPNCYPFHIGIEFKDDNTVFVKEADRDFQYRLTKFDDKPMIEFYDEDRSLYGYHIQKIDEDSIGLIGIGDFQGGQTCFLEKE